MKILEYLMKFNTLSLYWRNLRFSIIIILKIISLHLNHLKFQLKADHKSNAITLVHPDTIINKKILVTLYWLNLMIWCYQYTTLPQLQMLNYYDNNTLS